MSELAEKPIDYYFQPERDREFKRFEYNGNNYRITFTPSGISKTISRFNLLHTHECGENYLGCFWKPEALSNRYEGYLQSQFSNDTSFFAGLNRQQVIEWLIYHYEDWLDDELNNTFEPVEE